MTPRKLAFFLFSQAWLSRPSQAPDGRATESRWRANGGCSPAR